MNKKEEKIGLAPFKIGQNLFFIVSSTSFQFILDVLRLLYHQPSNAVTHSGFLYHLITVTDGVLIVDDELLALADTIVVPSPNIPL